MIKFTTLGTADLTRDIPISRKEMKDHLDFERHYQETLADEDPEAHQEYMRRRRQEMQAWKKRLEIEPFAPEIEVNIA